MDRIVIFGNSGSGKSTFAKAEAARLGCGHMDLDTVAWEPRATAPTRRSVADSTADILKFVNANPGWVIEGCYADLLEVVTPSATELVFLNPGVETCIENARNRPWEPHKYSSPEAQDANLDMLIGWIREYDRRRDEFSLSAHRRLFDEFTGRKREYTSNLRSG